MGNLNEIRSNTAQIGLKRLLLVLEPDSEAVVGRSLLYESDFTTVLSFFFGF